MSEPAIQADRATDEDPATLPVWRLSDLYPGPDSAELERDLSKADQDARAFHERHSGRVNSLDGDALAGAIGQYEEIDETLSRIMSYAYLIYAGDMSDPANGRFLQSMQERVTAISSRMIFFTLEINRLSEDALGSCLQAPALAHYGPWLRDQRAFADYQLTDDLERLLHEKSVTGRAAWVRLFDETLAALRFTLDGQEMTATEALNRMTDHDPVKRRAAAEEIGRVLSDNLRIFTHITNTLAKDKDIEDGWRGFKTPWSSRNLANHVEDEVVEALVSAVRAAYPTLSHRYYALKAKWFGGDRLDYWDRNAPLPGDNDPPIPWRKAQEIVLDAYGRFAPEMGQVGQRFFDEKWIDVPARPGKAPGAFSHPTVPSAHPYILVNYLGKTRDVMTLAHELGHGVHQVLAAHQGHLMADTPLTLAETASVFGEMLTFRALLDAETDLGRRRSILAGKVEDMLNTVIRQIAMFQFEQAVHERRKEAELTAEQLCETWMEVQHESLGPALRFGDAYRAYWSYIPHFIHSPFYVYAYAFGDCLVNSLYAVYQEAEDGFAAKYLDLLRAGGTLRHKELLAPFGLDAGDPGFWNRGLKMIEGLIDELDAIDR